MAPGLERASRNPVSFWDAVLLYGYRMPATRVDSAEAWHYHFQWTPKIEADAARLLSSGVRYQHGFSTGVTVVRLCPAPCWMRCGS
jgi:hypothetical protein